MQPSICDNHLLRGTLVRQSCVTQTDDKCQKLLLMMYAYNYPQCRDLASWPNRKPVACCLHRSHCIRCQCHIAQSLLRSKQQAGQMLLYRLMLPKSLLGIRDVRHGSLLYCDRRASNCWLVTWSRSWLARPSLCEVVRVLEEVVPSRVHRPWPRSQWARPSLCRVELWARPSLCEVELWARPLLCLVVSEVAVGEAVVVVLSRMHKP